MLVTSVVPRQLTSVIDLPPVRLLSLLGSAPLPALAPAIVYGFGRARTDAMLQPTSNVGPSRGVGWGGLWLLWLGAAKAVTQSSSSSATSRVLRQRGSGPDHMRQLVETGYTCVDNAPGLTQLLNSLLARMPRSLCPARALLRSGLARAAPALLCGRRAAALHTKRGSVPPLMRWPLAHTPLWQ